MTKLKGEEIAELQNQISNLIDRCKQLRREFENVKFLNREDDCQHVFKIHAVDFINDLSPRELQILKLYSTGATAQEISKKVYISYKTIAVYIDRVKDKLGLDTQLQLRCVAALIFARLEVETKELR